jgi:YbbR domain-containing protein
MKKLFTQNLGYRLVALILAVLLFAYVKTDHLTSTRISGSDSNQNNSALMSTKTATISMPVDLDVNTSKYVVSGYRENVKVTLSGTSAMVTTLTNTRNFKVYLDLQDYKSGEHTVKYRVTGLGKDIKYKINPETAKISIAKRKTKDFEIRYRYDTNMVKEGYTMGNVKSSTTNVQATGSAADIERISQVVADINVPSNATEDISARTVLQALDANGNIVNVVLTPQSVNVTIPVKKSETKAKNSESTSDQSSSKASSEESSSSDASTTSDDTTQSVADASTDSSDSTVSDSSAADSTNTADTSENVDTQVN